MAAGLLLNYGCRLLHRLHVLSAIIVVEGVVNIVVERIINIVVAGAVEVVDVPGQRCPRLFFFAGNVNYYRFIVLLLRPGASQWVIFLQFLDRFLIGRYF